MRFGDLFIEVSSTKQALALASLKRLAHFDIQVRFHKTLNFSRGVNLRNGYIQRDRRGNFRKYGRPKSMRSQRNNHKARDGQVLNTKHLILTFDTPDLPSSVKAAAATKTTENTGIQTEPVTITTSSSPTPGEITEKPKSIAVDTNKTASTTPILKKIRKTRIKEFGVQANKKKRSNHSKKPHDIKDDVMQMHASESDECLMEDQSSKLSSPCSLQEASVKT
ncbi:hypothetical protein TNCV_2585941 [Trichonephila clavipes]|nr:hypothetical protein TNCV_2585941 [Trichonephila clavipes]